MTMKQKYLKIQVFAIENKMEKSNLYVKDNIIVA